MILGRTHLNKRKNEIWDGSNRIRTLRHESEILKWLQCEGSFSVSCQLLIFHFLLLFVHHLYFRLCVTPALTFTCKFCHQRSFPYISAMVNNGSVSYDHGKDGRSSELGGCSAEIRNREHDTYLAIRYSKGRLTVCGHTLYSSSSCGRSGLVLFWFLPEDFFSCLV